MGESFKLHAQALTGYEDAIQAQSQSRLLPAMTSRPVFAVAAY